MSSTGAARAASVSSARAEASRRNGAKSRGPKTAAGKARSAQNALKHGLRAQQHVVLPDEAAAEFAALEAALQAELAPEGALQSILVRRIARAAWRLERVDRLEVEVLEEQRRGSAGISAGLALIRDGNGTRSFETLLRYRGAASAELLRSLRTLKALQAEQAVPAHAAAPAPLLALAPKRSRAGAAPAGAPVRGAAQRAAREQKPNEPAARPRPGRTAPAGPPRRRGQLPAGLSHARPNEPDARRNPRDSTACSEATRAVPARPEQALPVEPAVPPSRAC